MIQTPPYSGSLPAYVQISEAIAWRIYADQFLGRERLLTERKMLAEFGVTVGTLRKALHMLQKQKLAIMRCSKIQRH